MIDKYYQITVFSKAEEYAKGLHLSDAWKKANWRRKIKLAKKEYSRFFNAMDADENSRKITRRWENEKSLTEVFLKPLRIIGCCSVGELLYYNIKNSEGRYLTSRARKFHKCIHVLDIRACIKRKIPLKLTPLIYNEANRHPWDYFDYALKIKDKYTSQ